MTRKRFVGVGECVNCGDFTVKVMFRAFLGE